MKNVSTDIPQSSITMEAFHDLICQALKGRGKDSTAPSIKNPGVTSLARQVSQMCEIYAARSGWLKEHLSETKAFHDAVEILAALTSKHRFFYAQEVEMATSAVEKYGHGLLDAVERTQGNLAAVDTLSKALSDVISRGLPITPIEALGPDFGEGHTDIFKWRGYIEPLNRAFHTFLPGRTQADGYRFAQLIMPLITGEQPTLENIKNHLVQVGKA